MRKKKKSTKFKKAQKAVNKRILELKLLWRKMIESIILAMHHRYGDSYVFSIDFRNLNTTGNMFV